MTYQRKTLEDIKKEEEKKDAIKVATLQTNPLGIKA